MNAATVMVKQSMPAVTERQALWLEFYRALGARNLVCAVHLARQLGVDEARMRRIQRAALKQFIVEYQNFEGAARLCADYHIGSEEFAELITEILQREELEKQQTCVLQAGAAAHVSVAQQIRAFARRQLESLRQTERRKARADRRRQLVAKLKAWLVRLPNPWQGGFPHDGLAYG
jgi:hypothetical protein